MTPRVGLAGLLGAGNLGNDGSMEAILAYLGKEFPDADLDFFSTGADQLTARYGRPAVRMRWYVPDESDDSGRTAVALRIPKVLLGAVVDAFRTAGWVRGHDVVIIPGMGVLEATLPLRAWHTPYSMFLLCLSGRLFGAKVAFVSVGASEIHDALARRLVTAAARLASYRSFRDVLSREAMTRMGYDSSADPVYPDLAFALPVPQDGAPGTGAVGVGIMDFHGSNDERQQADRIHASYTATMKEFVLWLVDQGRPVRLFTTDVHDEPVMEGIVSDVRALRPGAGPSQLVAEPVSSLDELMRKIALVDTVVASRFHNVLSALKMRKPTLAVGYSKKFDALMTSMGVPEFCQPARSVELGRLIEQFTELERRAPELTQTISERAAAAERLVDGQFREMSVVLFGAAGPWADQEEPVRPSADVLPE